MDVIAEAWDLSKELTLAISNRPAPFKTEFKGMILSVNASGRACLLGEESLRGEPDDFALANVSILPPGKSVSMVEQIRYPPAYIWISSEQLAAKLKPVKLAYYQTNMMFAGMFIALAATGVGFLFIVRRGHEIAKLRAQFVSSVSHELRTPMALIRLYAESLSMENQSSVTRGKYTRAIMAETDRLTALVNNVLDFSRLEKDRLAVDMRTVEISKICEDVLDSFEVRLEREKVKAIRKINPDIYATVDPMALAQVLFNLVDNAVKYSSEGNVIEVELEKTESIITLKVKDNGIGIEEEIRGKIFQPFVRGKDSRVVSKRGSGIGLSISAELLKKMNCSIEALDNQPQGTVIEVKIPTD